MLIRASYMSIFLLLQVLFFKPTRKNEVTFRVLVLPICRVLYVAFCCFYSQLDCFDGACVADRLMRQPSMEVQDLFSFLFHLNLNILPRKWLRNLIKTKQMCFSKHSLRTLTSNAFQKAHWFHGKQ